MGGGEIWGVLTPSTSSCSLYPYLPLPGFSQALPSIHLSVHHLLALCQGAQRKAHP